MFSVFLSINYQRSGIPMEANSPHLNLSETAETAKLPLFAEEIMPAGLTCEIGTSIVLSFGKYVPAFPWVTAGLHQEHLV